jgi:uncharacterized membrane protein
MVVVGRLVKKEVDGLRWASFFFLLFFLRRLLLLFLKQYFGGKTREGLKRALKQIRFGMGRLLSNQAKIIK